MAHEVGPAVRQADNKRGAHNAVEAIGAPCAKSMKAKNFTVFHSKAGYTTATDSVAALSQCSSGVLREESIYAC